MKLTERIARFFDPLSRLTGAAFTRGMFSQAARNHQELIKKISDLYNIQGKNSDGAEGVSVVCGFRSDWICVNGLKVESENTANQEFIERFERWNTLSDYTFPKWVLGGEIEGRCLIKLEMDEDETGPIVSVKRIPYSPTRYEVVSLNNDPDDYDQVIFPSSDIKYTYDETVYVHLGGEAHYLNEPTPVVASILDRLIGISKCMNDLRKWNNKFGNALMFFSTDDKTTADDIIAAMDGRELPIGTVLAAAKTHGQFISPPPGSADTFKTEIELSVQVASGVSGVPIHVFGFISLFGTKAGAEVETQKINSRTSMSRRAWERKIKELYQKAAKMLIASGNGIGLDPNDFNVCIPAGSPDQLNTLVNVYKPLADDGYISSDWLRSRIPDYDSEEDKKALDEEKQVKQDNMNRKIDEATSGLFNQIGQ